MQSSRNSFKHGLTTPRTWSGADLADLDTQARILADDLGITSAHAINQFIILYFSRDRDLGIAATENLLFNRPPATVDLSHVRVACLQDNLSVSTLRTLKRQTVRQGRFVTKNYERVLELKLDVTRTSGAPVAPAKEFSRLAGQLKIVELDRDEFFALAAIDWNSQPPTNRLAVQIKLDIIMDEWRLQRLQNFGMLLLNQLSVSANGERQGHDFALLQDAQGFNCMEVLQDLEAALRKRIENRSKQLALANDGPWPAFMISEPVTAANETEGDNRTKDDTPTLAPENNKSGNKTGVDDTDTPVVTRATEPDTRYEN